MSRSSGARERITTPWRSSARFGLISAAPTVLIEVILGIGSRYGEAIPPGVLPTHRVNDWTSRPYSGLLSLRQWWTGRKPCPTADAWKRRRIFTGELPPDPRGGLSAIAKAVGFSVRPESERMSRRVGLLWDDHDVAFSGWSSGFYRVNWSTEYDRVNHWQGISRAVL